MTNCPSCTSKTLVNISDNVVLCPSCDALVIFINQSRWKAYSDCDRFYGWNYLENLVPSRPRKNLELGGAVHKAMVIAFEGNGTPQAFADGAKLAEAEFRKGMGAAQLPGDEAEILEGVGTIQRMLPAYHAHYASGQLWKPLGLEVAFCVEVGEGTNVYLVGRIDNLVTFMNGLWLVDYKTMQKLDMRNFLKYEIDIQLTAYIYGGTKQLTLDARKRGEPPVIIRGAIIDGMVKTQIPQFHRELYTRDINDLREFEAEFVEKAREIAVKHLRVHNGENWKTVFPKNTNQCYSYGVCPYRDLCIKDNEVRRMSFKKRSGDYVDDAAKVSVSPVEQAS